MNLQERLEQCRKDKAAIEEQEKELLEQIEQEKEPECGEIFTCHGQLRLIVEVDNVLRVIDCTNGRANIGTPEDYIKSCHYHKTNKNIKDIKL